MCIEGLLSQTVLQDVPQSLSGCSAGVVWGQTDKKFVNGMMEDHLGQTSENTPSWSPLCHLLPTWCTVSQQYELAQATLLSLCVPLHSDLWQMECLDACASIKANTPLTCWHTTRHTFCHHVFAGRMLLMAPASHPKDPQPSTSAMLLR